MKLAESLSILSPKHIEQLKKPYSTAMINQLKVLVNIYRLTIQGINNAQ